MLIFNEEEHTYTNDGIKLTSVTTMIKDVGIIDDRFFKPSGTNRGTLVHRITEELDKGVLDWSVVTEEVLPYLDAWIAFKEQYKPIFTSIEEIMYHPLFNYAGMADRITDDYIFDIKSGQSAKWHQLQLTLYGMMVQHNTGKKLKLAGVYVKKTGKYAFKEYEWDEKTAMSIIRINQWKMK